MSRECKGCGHAHRKGQLCKGSVAIPEPRHGLIAVLAGQQVLTRYWVPSFRQAYTRACLCVGALALVALLGSCVIADCRSYSCAPPDAGAPSARGCR